MREGKGFLSDLFETMSSTLKIRAVTHFTNTRHDGLMWMVYMMSFLNNFS
jgi:hypothetical protein